MQPPLGADALPQYYHTTSFNYDNIKARDVGWIVDIIQGILCLIVPRIKTEREETFKDFFWWGATIVLDSNYREYS